MTHNHFETVLSDPARHYNEPREVLVDEHLTQLEKVEVLQEWQQEALALCRADEENMAKDQSTMLSRVNQALAELESKS